MRQRPLSVWGTPGVPPSRPAPDQRGILEAYLRTPVGRLNTDLVPGLRAVEMFQVQARDGQHDLFGIEVDSIECLGQPVSGRRLQLCRLANAACRTAFNDHELGARQIYTYNFDPDPLVGRPFGLVACAPFKYRTVRPSTQLTLRQALEEAMPTIHNLTHWSELTR